MLNITKDDVTTFLSTVYQNIGHPITLYNRYYYCQGVGGNPVCKNVTKDDGTISFQPVSEEPRFTAQVCLDSY